MKVHMILLVILIGTPTLAKSSGDNNGILTEIMREQMKMIKHCLSTRCHGSSSIYGTTHQKQYAFHAYPTSSLRNIPKNTKVVFGTASENVGNAYDTTTGIFTAPVDGVYVFHWTTKVHPGKYFATYLVVNGNKKSYNNAYAGYNKDWYSPSQMFVGHLRHGDKVWLVTDGNVGQFMHGGIHSSFSGFKL